MGWHLHKPLGLALALAFLGGCASTQTTVSPAPSAGFTQLSEATGSACGSMGILGTATNFIPMGLNSRYDRAYQEALASVPGATGLINVTLQENWVWWVIGTSRCVTVTGTAVK